MKKLYLRGAIGLLLLSCKTDDDNENDTSSIVSIWKFSKAEVISGSNNTVLYSETLAGCDANTTLNLRMMENMG